MTQAQASSATFAFPIVLEAGYEPWVGSVNKGVWGRNTKSFEDGHALILRQACVGDIPLAWI